MAGLSRYETAKRVTAVNALTNTLLAFFKIIVGYWGHSQALITDGIHSLSDLISDALVLIAAKIGGKTPDADHPYGHQRIETLAAMIIAIILILVGGFIIYETYHHIRHGQAPPVHSLPVIIAALAAIGMKEWLFRYTLKMGKKIHSQLLITSAYHNRSDVWVSALVVLSAIGDYLKIPYADNICAGIIALVILKSGGQLFFRGVMELIDTGVDETLLQGLKACIQSTPGVVSIHQLRTRSHGGNIFVDLHIIVNTFISVSEGHHIGEKIHEKLMREFPQIADVTVHIDPENDETDKVSLNLPNRLEILAELQPHWENLPGYQQIEKIDIHYFNGQINLEICWAQNAVAIELWPEIAKSYAQVTRLLPHITGVKLMVRIL
jgi:cation diffusion facilitator family transporter